MPRSSIHPLDYQPTQRQYHVKGGVAACLTLDNGAAFVVLRATIFYPLILSKALVYPPRWRGQDCSFCENAGDALSVLSQVVAELEARKTRFAAAGVAHGTSCSSLDDYNRLSPDAPLRRIVVAVDEIAELTDTSGASKPEKEQIAAIIGKLSTIARLGRAFGITLLIGTQRPDANAVPGQIKNNLDYRVCGKADNTLSIIILDSADAADLIPKDSQGLFLNHEGVLFRGYLYRT